MLTKEKIAAVKKQLRSGVPEGEIKNELKNEGYTEDEIKEIFAPVNYDMRSWYLVFGIAFSIGGFCLLEKEYGLHLMLTGLGLVALYINEERKRKK
jgi:hypothetical protein